SDLHTPLTAMLSPRRTSPPPEPSHGRVPVAKLKRTSPPRGSRAARRPTPSMIPVNIIAFLRGDARAPARHGGGWSVAAWSVSRVRWRKTSRGKKHAHPVLAAGRGVFSHPDSRARPVRHNRRLRHWTGSADP